MPRVGRACARFAALAALLLGLALAPEMRRGTRLGLSTALVIAAARTRGLRAVNLIAAARTRGQRRRGA